MRRIVFPLSVLAAHATGLLAIACNDARAGVDVTDVRASREPDQRIAVDVDLVAHEGLGGPLGTYCTRVDFPWQPRPAEVCKADLHDGDTTTIRLVSDLTLAPGAPIHVRVRHFGVDHTRDLAAPP